MMESFPLPPGAKPRTRYEALDFMERALLRLNPKALGRAAYVSDGPAGLFFCVLGATRAAFAIGPYGRIVSGDDVVMRSACGAGSTVVSSFSDNDAPYRHAMERNDGFKGTPEERYTYMLRWVRREKAKAKRVEGRYG